MIQVILVTELTAEADKSERGSENKLNGEDSDDFSHTTPREQIQQAIIVISG